MFKREMKVNLKNFLIWLSILLFIFLIVFLVYPSIANSDKIKEMNEMMEIFPKEMLTAFNMDISSIDTAYGWLKTEGFIFILLIIGCYSGILGSNILLKEENDKTIEYLNSLPITRNKIVGSKMLAGLIYVILMILILGIFNYICLLLSGDFNKLQFILLSLTPLFSSVCIYFICMFISTYMQKSKKMSAFSFGFVFISYMMQMISSISKNVDFLKYFSIFTLADIRNVIKDVKINPIMIVIFLGISILFTVLSFVKYNKKELS